MQIKLETVKTDPSIPVYSDGFHWAFPSLSLPSLSLIDSAGAEVNTAEEPKDGQLPFSLLASRDPIQWYASFTLFEDDLHDFGMLVSECRIVSPASISNEQRVMENFFYVLLQEYLRIDRQVVYLISHRYYYVLLLFPTHA